MMRALVAFIMALLLLVPAYAASGVDEITPDDIAAADARRKAVGAELEETTRSYDAAVSRNIEIEDQLRKLAADISVAERTLAELRVEAEQVARTMYMELGSTGVVTALDAQTINDIPVREGYLSKVSSGGQETLARLVALEDAYHDQQALLDDLKAEQQEMVDELDVLAAEILDQLAAADADYNAVVADYQAQEEAKRRAAEEARRRAEEEARARAEAEAAAAAAATATTAPPTSGGGATTTAPPAGGGGGGGGGDDAATTTTAAPPDTTTPPPPPPPPPSGGGKACPVAGAVSFTDTYGASRSGGRAHQGVDMIAAKGTPVAAIESGTVSTRSSTLGGLTIYLYGASGDSYYYAHLDSYSVGDGASVSAGQHIGTVGNTGNAQYTVAHLHFEYHPGGGGAVNPTPLAWSVC